MPLSIELAIKISELPFIQEVNLLKQEADAFRPLDNETEQKIIQKFRLLWNYHSNAIEGNQLTYGETYAFLMEGVTAKGKTLKDHLDIKGHDETVKYLFDLIKSKEYEITEAEIRNLHKMLLKEPYEVDAVTLDGKPTKRNIQIGEYKSFPNHVQTATGEIHYYATPQETPIRMGELMAWYKEAKENTAIHPLVIATLFHHEFTNIHPFDDGNGRMGRLLLNLMVQQYGYTPIVVKQQDRMAYYQVLRQADAGEYLPINEYMSELMKESLSLYIKGAKGESIEEEDDIDKEIMLFKKGLGKDELINSKSEQSILEIIENILIPILNIYIVKSKALDDVFVNKKSRVEVFGIDSILSIGSLKKNDLKNFKTLLNEAKSSIKHVVDLFNSQPHINDSIQGIRITFDYYGYKKKELESNIANTITIDISDNYFFNLLDTSNKVIFKKPYGYKAEELELKEIANNELRKLIEQLKSLESK